MGYHNWTTYACNGTFYEGSQQNMRVTERGDYIETLLYTGENRTCGVFTVQPAASAHSAKSSVRKALLNGTSFGLETLQ
ncbi:uncharacterized protein LOC142587769 isoform X2 [Dermacentor variabilis]|uniref:uncharacterized protein LOC142587769 isoform X2 n=1 Tax=Dermacentor variabilis TaxID=34621 RepID=UPI003F5C7068